MQQITRDYLKKTYAAKNGSMRGLLILAAAFALVCILLLPNRVLGVGAAVVVMAIAGGIYTKIRKAGGAGNAAKAYFRYLCVTDKKESADADPDGNGNAYAVHFDLYFGENNPVEVTRQEYDAAQIGDAYYVAYFSESSVPFACFSAAQYVLSPDLPLRQ